MAKDILVFSGSPHKSGNSNMMAEFFIRSAESKGHTVKRIDCTRLHVSGCLAIYNYVFAAQSDSP